MRIAVFASGSGSNFAAVSRAIRNNKIIGEVVILITDNPEAYAIERARRLGVPWQAFNPRDYASKADFESHVLQELRRREVDFVVLAGYMRIVGPTLLDEFEGRMINLHPSLLPSFPGKDAIGQALAHGVSVTGVTVHYVDSGLDTGPIIDQMPVIVKAGETRQTLERKIHAIEHQLLVQVIDKLSRSFTEDSGHEGGDATCAAL